MSGAGDMSGGIPISVVRRSELDAGALVHAGPGHGQRSDARQRILSPCSTDSVRGTKVRR